MQFPWLQMPFPMGDDALPPVISNASPASGATLGSGTASVAFDLTDASGVITYLQVGASYDDRPQQMIVWGDPDVPTWAEGWTGSVTPITGGYRVTLTPEDSWGDNPEVSAFAVDPYGNQLVYGDTVLSYVLNAVPVGGEPDVSPPTVTLISPPENTAIRRGQVITFEVTDVEGLSLFQVIAQFPDDSWEVVHDGTTFAPMYQNASASQTPITGGYRFTVLRNGGWHRAPTIDVKAADASGNVATGD